MSRPFDTLVFDFDYTLADSSVGVGICINTALETLGFPAVDLPAACGTIGMSLTDTFLALVGAQHRAAAETFAHLFVTQADRIMVEQTKLLGSVYQTIQRLHRSAYQLGIVSNNRRYRIESVLRREGILGYFRSIIGEEDIMQHKPEPDGLISVIRRLHGTPARSVYIGDSLVDAETARRANVAFIAVLSGTTPRAAFDQYNVYATIESLSELSELGVPLPQTHYRAVGSPTVHHLPA